MQANTLFYSIAQQRSKAVLVLFSFVNPAHSGATTVSQRTAHKYVSMCAEEVNSLSIAQLVAKELAAGNAGDAASCLNSYARKLIEKNDAAFG